MSLAQVIIEGIRVARSNLGDLIEKATLVTVTKTYDTTQGKNVESKSEVEVEIVRDKFTWVEQQAPGFQETDVKVLMFNPNNDIEVDANARLVLDDTTLHVKKVDPSWVGGYKPVITLVLRR